MRHAFIRFVCHRLDENSGRRQGLFQVAAELLDASALAPQDHEELKRLKAWFNEHLAQPDRFTRSRKSRVEPKAISWFKASATEHVSRMHAICRILSDHGVATEVITCSRPGYIVFEDEHQVAAEPSAETTT